MSHMQNGLCAKELRGLFINATKLSEWEVPDHFPDRIEHPFSPAKENIFKAFELIAPKEVKYVILGKDPYPTTNMATGIAFDVPGEKAPLSLTNILNELGGEGGNWQDKLARFKKWYKSEGILLLNAALTVAAGDPGSHIKHWKEFMLEIIRSVVEADTSNKVRFLAWGGDAGNVMKQALNGRREFTWACHPQPRNGSNCFAEFWEHSPVAKQLRDSYMKHIPD